MSNIFFEAKPVNTNMVKVTEKITTLNFNELIKKVDVFLINNGYDKDSYIVFDYTTDWEYDFLMIEKTPIAIEKIIELSQVLYDVDDEKLLTCINQNSKKFLELLSNCYFESANNLLKMGCRKNFNNSRLEKLINSNAISQMLKEMKQLIEEE